MFGILNAEEIEEFLSKNLVGHLGCHFQGKTYIVPISYVYDKGFVYAHTKEGMKVNFLRQDPRVCFEVDLQEDMANWKSVIAWGEFEELKDEPFRTEALNKLTSRILPLQSSQTTHLFPHWPFVPDDLTKITGIVFCIRLTEKSGRFERPEPESTFAS